MSKIFFPDNPLKSSRKSIDLKNLSLTQVNKIFKKLIYIREVELLLARKKKHNFFKTPVHLCVGQEAISVGISENLRNSDYVFGNHRSHGHILSLGTNLIDFFSEILSKPSGLSKGRGGSMHMIDQKNGFMGSLPIVAGTIPLAVGAALSSKMDKSNKIAVAFFGDGACEEGAFHESLNLASILDLPILFVAENNLYSSHLHISQRQKLSNVSRYARANGINYEILDGNNPIKIYESSKNIIKNIRKDKKPFFIEAVTFRQLGHVDWREDVDVGVYRSKKTINSWKKNDPILRLYKAMLKKRMIDQKKYENLVQQMKYKINLTWGKSLKKQNFSKIDLLKNVYS